MITRTFKIVAALLLSLVGVAGSAHALYPPGGTVVTTDRSSYVSGTTVNVTAAAFQACAGALVTFTITLPGGPTTTMLVPASTSGFMRSAATTARPATVTGNVIILTSIANPDGTATVTLVAPATLGIYTVIATSPGCPNASTTFTVVRRPNLPTAGSETGQWILLGAALVFTGLGFAFVARRRRQPVAAV